MVIERNIVEVRVGKAAPQELPVVLSIYRAHNGDCRDVGCHNTYVARNDSLGVVGAVTIKEVQPGWAQLRTMGVEPELRGRGIGTQLALSVIDELRKQGYRTVTVDLDLMEPRQKEFFGKLGFQQLDSHSMVRYL
ncbi:MAG: GNAT family N-acetyltransferase [Candidatus Micrarchaeia archaeon]